MTRMRAADAGCTDNEPMTDLSLSAAGFAPKLLSYTFMGTNVFDPLSSAFLVPLVIALTISGASLLCVNLIWLLVEKSVSSSKKNKDN